VRSRAEAVAVMEERRRAGETSDFEVSVSRAALAQAQLRARAEEGRHLTSRLALAAALGLPGGALDGVELAWPGFDEPRPEDAFPAAAVLDSMRRNRLDLHRSLAEYEAAEAALRLEVARQYPDLRLVPGYTYDQGDSKLKLGLAVEVPIFHRHEGPIAEASARRETAAARVRSTQAAGIAEVQGALARYGAARRLLDEARSIAASLRDREASLRRRVEAGEDDRLALLVLEVELASAESLRVEALASARDALGQLEDALGAPIEDGAPQAPRPSPGERS
jgi:outer membrane protein, heavy metal efflux system